MNADYKLGLYISFSNLLRLKFALKFSLQLTNTIGAKKKSPLIRGFRFLESWAILALFSKISFIPISEVVTVKWKTLGSLWTKKRKKEMILNCFNLKCFKTKYQLVKSITQTLF